MTAHSRATGLPDLAGDVRVNVTVIAANTKPYCNCDNYDLLITGLSYLPAPVSTSAPASESVASVVPALPIDPQPHPLRLRPGRVEEVACA